MGGAYVGGYTWPAKRKLRVTQSENYLYKGVRAILHLETCHTCVCLHVLSGTRAKFKTESAMNDSANLGLSIVSSCGKVKLNCKNKELVIYREYTSRLSHKIDIDNPLLF